MSPREIKALRNALALFGIERTPDQVANARYMKDVEELKKNFFGLKRYVDPLQKKYDACLIDLEQFAEEMSEAVDTECTEEMCRHFIIMNNIFDYGEADG